MSNDSLARSATRRSEWPSLKDAYSNFTLEELWELGQRFFAASQSGEREVDRCPECFHSNRLNGRIVHATNCSLQPYPIAPSSTREPEVLRITEVIGQDGKPVAAPCCISGCQYWRYAGAGAAPSAIERCEHGIVRGMQCWRCSPGATGVSECRGYSKGHATDRCGNCGREREEHVHARPYPGVKVGDTYCKSCGSDNNAANSRCFICGSGQLAILRTTDRTGDQHG